MAKQIDSDSRLKAVGYVRVSSKAQADEGQSLEDQRNAIILHAVATGLNLVDVYADAGISGGKGEDRRPGLAGALDVIREGKASVLVVTHTDRLSRDGDLAGYLKVELKKAGGSLLSLDGVKDDPITAAAKRFIAEVERIRGSQRMRFAYAAKARKGEWVGAVPFGSHVVGKQLEDHPDEQAAIRRVVGMREQGKTLRAIVAALAAARVTFRNGKPWNVETVRAVLTRAGVSTKRSKQATS